MNCPKCNGKMYFNNDVCGEGEKITIIAFYECNCGYITDSFVDKDFDKRYKNQIEDEDLENWFDQESK